MNTSKIKRGIISQGKSKNFYKLEFLLFIFFFIVFFTLMWSGREKGIKKRKTNWSAHLAEAPTFPSNKSNIKNPNYSMHVSMDVATFYTSSRRNFQPLNHLIPGFLKRSSKWLYTSETTVKSSTLPKNQSVVPPEKSSIIMLCKCIWMHLEMLWKWRTRMHSELSVYLEIILNEYEI